VILMESNCADCGHPMPLGSESRCPMCYVNFALERGVHTRSIREVLNKMRGRFDIAEAKEIIRQVEEDGTQGKALRV